MALRDIQRSRAMWWALALVLAGALAYVVYSFIGTFVFGLFIYYATRPIYRRIRRRVKPPSLAAAVALFALALPALGLVAYAATIALREFLKYADQLSSDEVPIDLEAYGIDPTLLEGIASPQALLEYDFRSVLTPEAISSVFDSLSVAANTFAFLGIGAIHLFVMIAFAFYLLRDGHRLRRWGQSMFADDHGILEAYMRGVDRDFNNIFFGNILNAILTGTIGVIAYSLLNVIAPVGVHIPAPALIGLLAGVASLIPVVGMKLVYVPVAAYMALEATIANPPRVLVRPAFRCRLVRHRGYDSRPRTPAVRLRTEPPRRGRDARLHVRSAPVRLVRHLPHADDTRAVREFRPARSAGALGGEADSAVHGRPRISGRRPASRRVDRRRGGRRTARNSRDRPAGRERIGRARDVYRPRREIES